MSSPRVTLQDAISRSGLRSGGTVSFHHHLRNGDTVMVQALTACRALGLRGLHIAPSSLFPCHGDLIPFVRDGTISKVTTAYMNGLFADFVSGGGLAEPVRFTTHGGRARLIETGEQKMDVAIIAAPCVSPDGDIGGADGDAACGPLGYAMPDAAHAVHVLAVTPEIQPNLSRVCIPAAQVDQIIQVPSIGDGALMSTGTVARKPDAIGQGIADLTIAVLRACGAIRPGLRFQAGAGAVSLAVTRGVGAAMADAHVTGAFAVGGITETLVHMKAQGLFKRLMNVQSFDRSAVHSYAVDPDHIALSASEYASPAHPKPVSDQLDVAILGAAEVDTGFNVNVTTTSDGRIIGGSGGHQDIATGAGLSIVVVPTQTKGTARIVERVACVTTPGHAIDLVVTERGVCVHPNRPDLTRDLLRAGIAVHDIHDLAHSSLAPAGTGRIIAKVEDRLGNPLCDLRMPDT